MLVAQSQKHASAGVHLGSQGANPAAQVPSLKDFCLPQVHPHLHVISYSSYGTIRANFMATGKVKTSNALCLTVEFVLCKAGVCTTSFTAYSSLKPAETQTKPKSHPKPFAIHDIQT